jgi:hypothetical protein
MPKTEWKGFIEVQQLKRLKVIAAREKVSVAWAVRKAIDVAYPGLTSRRAS